LNEERKKVGRNKQSVSGLDDHAGNGLRPYLGLRKTACLLAQMKTAVVWISLCFYRFFVLEGYRDIIIWYDYLTGDRLTHRMLDSIEKSRFTGLEEGVEIVATERCSINEVRVQNLTHSRLINASVPLEAEQIITWRIVANHPVGSCRQWGFVYDAIAASRIYPISLAPILREDVVDVDSIIKVKLYVYRIASTEILTTITH
jgi:hypothetical protein